MPITRPLAALAGALLSTAAFAAAASAAPSPPANGAPMALIVTPRTGATVSGVVRPTVRVGRRSAIRRHELRVDGRLVAAWSPRARVVPEWATTTVADGRHRIDLVTVGTGGMRRDVRRVTVRNGAGSRKTRPRAGIPAPLPAAPDAPPAAAPVAPPAPPPAAVGLDIPGVIMRTGDFDTGDLSQWSGHQNLRPYSLTTVASPAREGAHAARFEVRRGDDPICAAGGGCFGDRSEVQMSTGEAEGQERWYSWSTLIGADFPRSSAWQVVSQWHANADGSPPIAFFAENDDLVLRVHRYAGPGRLIDVVDVWRGPLRRGAWQDIRMHVKWSASDTTGYVELSIDGVPQVLGPAGGTRRSIRTLYPGGMGAYFKQGLYRQAGIAQTGVVLHDGFRMSRPG